MLNNVGGPQYAANDLLSAQGIAVRVTTLNQLNHASISFLLRLLVLYFSSFHIHYDRIFLISCVVIHVSTSSLCRTMLRSSVSWTSAARSVFVPLQRLHASPSARHRLTQDPQSVTAWTGSLVTTCSTSTV